MYDDIKIVKSVDKTEFRGTVHSSQVSVSQKLHSL